MANHYHWIHSCQWCDYIYFEFMPTTGNEKELEESYRNVPLYLQLIAIGILGPILEEIIFRGLLIKGIFRVRL